MAPMVLSWVSFPEDSEFSLRNLPLGVFSDAAISPSRRCATRLGDTVVDLSVLEEAGLFDDISGLSANTFCQETLNGLLEHPPPVWTAFRKRLVALFQVGGDDRLQTNGNLQKASFHDAFKVTLHLPILIGDYTDFYSSREHATNVGTMFRGPDNALQPNWLHLPVGYHGRASTVFASGEPVRRPSGQLQKDNKDPALGSVHGPCAQLDFELEVAAVVGGLPNKSPLTMEQAKERIFGFMLMNDWSARGTYKTVDTVEAFYYYYCIALYAD
jgi:fumarylacetoacetase